MRIHDGRQPISNYAFKPIAEQALRSIQIIVPQRLNAALDLGMEMAVFELIVVLPFLMLWFFLVGAVAAIMKHLGRFRVLPFLAFASIIAAVLTAAVTLNNLAAYTNLVSRGEIIVSNGQVLGVGYFMAMKYSLVAALLAAGGAYAPIILNKLVNGAFRRKV